MKTEELLGQETKNALDKLPWKDHRCRKIISDMLTIKLGTVAAGESRSLQACRYFAMQASQLLHVITDNENAVSPDDAADLVHEVTCAISENSKAVAEYLHISVSPDKRLYLAEQVAPELMARIFQADIGDMRCPSNKDVRIAEDTDIQKLLAHTVSRGLCLN
mgnify:CR=1 FL=1